MLRIFVFGSAVAGLLFVTLSYAVIRGEVRAEPGASVSGEPSPSAGGGTTVTIANLAFGPDLTVAPGTAVTFTNNDTVLHTATNGTDGNPAPSPLFDLQLPVGASESYTFPEPGTYPVTCLVHPTMNMTITVQ